MTNDHVVIMGVAGCGKSSIGQALRARLNWAFAEGDAFHPEVNVAKMSAGIPLTDEDRWPWLRAIASWTADRDAAGRSTVVTCSALRRIYRDILRQVPGRALFVHLSGPEELIRLRMAARADHFMPTSLLPSQFATLEPLEPDEGGIVIGIESDLETTVEAVIECLADQRLRLPTSSRSIDRSKPAS